jgi:MFS family permease
VDERAAVDAIRHARSLGTNFFDTAQALGVMAGAQIAGRAYPRIGPCRMLTAGMVGVAAATALMITVGPGTSLWWIRALLLLLDSAETETPHSAASACRPDLVLYEACASGS